MDKRSNHIRALQTKSYILKSYNDHKPFVIFYHSYLLLPYCCLQLLWCFIPAISGKIAEISYPILFLERSHELCKIYNYKTPSGKAIPVRLKHKITRSCVWSCSIEGAFLGHILFLLHFSRNVSHSHLTTLFLIEQATTNTNSKSWILD